MQQQAPKKTVENSMLVVTALFVVALAFPTYQSLVSAPKSNDKKVSVVEDTVVDRSPASVNSSAQNLVALQESAGPVLVDWSCGKPVHDKTTNASQLRLAGDKCAKETSIVNKTNGFTASVLPLDEKRMTTDFIDLKIGENVIEISDTDAKGKVSVRQFKVTRRSPASL